MDREEMRAQLEMLRRDRQKTDKLMSHEPSFVERTGLIPALCTGAVFITLMYLGGFLPFSR
jgi:hypothetical protein